MKYGNRQDMDDVLEQATTWCRGGGLVADAPAEVAGGRQRRAKY